MKHLNETLIGRPTVDVVRDIVENRARLRQLYLASYEYVSVYHLDKLGFRESINPGILHPIDRALIGNYFWLDDVRDLLKLSPESYVGIGSRVLLDRGFYHIPMVDFDKKNNKGLSLDDVKETLSNLCFPNGYLASSGRGFHYIGAHLMSEGGFNKALLELRKQRKATGVDKQWLFLAEYYGLFTLRLTKGAEKPTVPTVVDFHFLSGRPIEQGTKWNICTTRYGAAINQFTILSSWELEQGDKTGAGKS